MHTKADETFVIVETLICLLQISPSKEIIRNDQNNTVVQVHTVFVLGFTDTLSNFADFL